MEKTALKLLRAQSHSLQPTVRIGKSGFSQAIVDEAKKQIRKKKLIKIKILNVAVEGKGREETEQIIEEFAKKLGAEIVHKVGFAVTLYKK